MTSTEQTVTRITKTSESTMPSNVGMIELARDIMAGQAREGAPRVYVSESGMITLTYPDGTKVRYLTDVSCSVPISKR